MSKAGTGLVIAFTPIYLHQVRALTLPVVGALLAASAAAGLIVMPAAGAASGLIAAGAPGVWIGLLCLGCLGTVAVGAVLRRTLTVEQDRVQPGGNGYGQAVGPLPSQPRRLNIVSSKTIATSSVPMPRNRK